MCQHILQKKGGWREREKKEGGRTTWMAGRIIESERKVEEKRNSLLCRQRTDGHGACMLGIVSESVGPQFALVTVDSSFPILSCHVVSCAACSFYIHIFLREWIKINREREAAMAVGGLGNRLSDHPSLSHAFFLTLFQCCFNHEHNEQ